MAVPWQDVQIHRDNRMQNVLIWINSTTKAEGEEGCILARELSFDEATRLMGLNDTDEISARIYALGNENTIIHQRCNNDDA